MKNLFFLFALTCFIFSCQQSPADKDSTKETMTAMDPAIDYPDDLVFEEVRYPGYRISYDDGVGLSPKDEYFIHYNSETYEMAWLGYTVTFKSGEKSERISWIRYNDWKDFDGFKLSASLSWYKTENNLPTELRNTRKFAGVKVSKEAASEGTFEMPEGAKVVD